MMVWTILALAVGVCTVFSAFEPTSPVERDYPGLQVKGFSVHGEVLFVSLHNPGPTRTGGAVATAVVNGHTQRRTSRATRIGAGATVIVKIEYPGPIAGITEGPDPIPQ